jgi:hypothetical protein
MDLVQNSGLDSGMKTLRIVITLALLCVAASASEKVRSIDLKPYGFEPVTNREYRAHIFTSAMDYLKDGTLVLAFPAPYSSLDPKHEHVFGTQRATVLHFDPASGKLLHRFEGLVSNELRFLAAVPDGGFLLVQRRDIVFYSKDCDPVGSIHLPLDVESVEVSPSRRYITLAAATGSTLHATIVDTTTRTSVKQFEIQGGPIVLLGDGYALLKNYSTSGVSIGGVRRSTVVGKGYEVSFAVAPPKSFDLGPAFDCPTAFEAASDEAIAYATCGLIQIVNQRGKRLFKETFKHSTVIRVSAAMKGGRLAYSTVRGPYAKTTEQLRATGKDFSVRVADLENQRVLASIPIVPFPRIGGSFALSPDGRGLAIMTDGALEIFQLP